MSLPTLCHPLAVVLATVVCATVPAALEAKGDLGEQPAQSNKHTAADRSAAPADTRRHLAHHCSPWLIGLCATRLLPSQGTSPHPSSVAAVSLRICRRPSPSRTLPLLFILGRATRTGASPTSARSTRTSRRAVDSLTKMDHVCRAADQAN